MMTKDEITLRVSETMQELFNIEPARLKPETTLIGDLGLDSIDAIDLAARLEEITGRRLPEAKLRGLRTVADVVETIHALLQEPPADEATTSSHRGSGAATAASQGGGAQ